MGALLPLLLLPLLFVQTFVVWIICCVDGVLFTHGAVEFSCPNKLSIVVQLAVMAPHIAVLSVRAILVREIR